MKLDKEKSDMVQIISEGKVVGKNGIYEINGVNV